jgi:DNA repair protein RadC
MSEETTKFVTIKQWAEDDRPREKAMTKGFSALSDTELLAILISTGTRDESAVDLAKRILALTNNNLVELGKLKFKDLQKVKGIGVAKAITIATAMELGRRRNLAEAKSDHIFLKSSAQAFAYFHPILADSAIEEFWVAYLNRSNRLIEVKRVSEGGVSGTVADPKVIFKHAVDLLASNIVLCHNHPSGSKSPSDADKRLTKRLVEAGRLIDVHVMDHIIIAEEDYYSFADESML